MVKLAERKQDGVMVVVKQINLSCMSPKEIADAQREVSILSQFDHANIIKYLDCVVDEVTPLPTAQYQFSYIRANSKQQRLLIAASRQRLSICGWMDGCTLRRLYSASAS